MQELLPIELLVIAVAFVGVMVFMTYYGFKRITRGFPASSFSRPRMSTMFGVWTFMSIGVLFGIFAVLAIYTGPLGIIGFDWLFNNVHTFILVTAFIVAFAVPVGYLYIYRGGA